MANWLPITFGILATLGVGLVVLCLATNNWRSYSAASVKRHEGLFKYCFSVKDSSSCHDLYSDFGNLPAKFAGVVAMTILAVLFEALAIIVGTVAVVVKKKLNGVVAAMQALAIIFAAGGLGLYAKYYIVGLWDADWSYIMGWIGTSFLGIGLVIMIIIMAR